MNIRLISPSSFESLRCASISRDSNCRHYNICSEQTDDLSV